MPIVMRRGNSGNETLAMPTASPFNLHPDSFSRTVAQAGKSVQPSLVLPGRREDSLGKLYLSLSMLS